MPFAETMTPRERVMNALEGKPVDRPPIANPTNVATVELMDMMDAPFPDACRDPELAARLAATGHTELGFDSVMPYFSIIQESSALGCEMAVGGEGQLADGADVQPDLEGARRRSHTQRVPGAPR